MTSPTTTSLIESSNIESQVSAGLDFILSHLSKPDWPRTISTKAIGGIQKSVGSKMEAMLYFKQANYQDCRISAYNNKIREQNNGIVSSKDINSLMIDLDLSNFKSRQELENAKDRTLSNIYKLITAIYGHNKVKPRVSVVWSGNGYHIYLVVDSQHCDKVDSCQRLLPVKLQNIIDNPSKYFLRFMELQLSNGLCDKEHNRAVSFKNCMLRIPGTFNSKRNMTQVQIIERWDGQSKLLAHIFLAQHKDVFLKYLKAEALRIKAALERKEEYTSHEKRFLERYKKTEKNAKTFEALQQYYKAKDLENQIRYSRDSRGRWGYYANNS